MCLSSKFAHRSAGRRYERGRAGFASFAARPRLLCTARAPRRGAKAVALAARATAPPALARRPLRLSRLQRSSARVSESSAALQTRVRERRFKMLRPKRTGVASMCALPCGTRAPIFADA
jgi:hypothetical protein